jgi:peptide-methionine (S)-S-oxide reductase
MMPQTERATFGGGCFWCLEAVFEQLKGVQKVVSGYAGGAAADADYRTVCSGRTGHAEVVQITFDPAVITYKDLLDVFFGTHDPTTLNRQGADEGTQYRSVIYYHSPEQKAAADEAIRELTAAKVWPNPIVTQLVPLEAFYPAEEYHQGYYRANSAQPYCVAVVGPKAAKARKVFARLLKAR